MSVSDAPFLFWEYRDPSLPTERNMRLQEVWIEHAPNLNEARRLAKTYRQPHKSRKPEDYQSLPQAGGRYVVTTDFAKDDKATLFYQHLPDGSVLFAVKNHIPYLNTEPTPNHAQ